MISKSNTYAIFEIAVPVEIYDDIVECFRKGDEDDFDFNNVMRLENERRWNYEELGELILNRYDFCSYKGVNKAYVDRLMGYEEEV